MKTSKLISLQSALASRSKRPWACFETGGVSADGQLGVAMNWNDAFIRMLHDMGIQGTNEQETIQLFFLFMAGRIGEDVAPADTVSPDATPSLTSEANTFLR